MTDDAIDPFGPGQLDVGALTDAEHRRIMDEGARLSADVLWSRDEVLRWRRFLKVWTGWRRCDRCGTWTERAPADPCKGCGAPPDP